MRSPPSSKPLCQQVGNAALLNPLVLDDRLERILVTSSDLIRQTTSVDCATLNQTILSFRTVLTSDRSIPECQGQQLYDWLLQPIADRAFFFKRLKFAGREVLMVPGIC